MVRSAKRKIVLAIAATVAVLAGLEILLFRAAAHIVNDRVSASGGCSCAMDTLITARDWAILGFAGLFSVGVLVGMTYAVIALIRTRTLLKHVSVYEGMKGLFLFNGSHCESFTFGFLRPKIALCAHCVRNLSKDELAAILQHESHHVAKRHPLKFFVTDTVKYSFFFAPFLRNLISEYRTMAEIEADERVDSRQALGGVLLQMVQRPEFASIAASFASRLSIRIDRLIKPNWKASFQLDVSSVFITLAIVLGVAGTILVRPAAAGVNMCPMHPRQQCVRPMLDAAPSVYYNSSN